MKKIFFVILCSVLAGCCSSGTKRDWFSQEVEILPIKSFIMEFGYVGNDYLTDKFQATINGKKEFLNIADFNEFKWGTYYKVVLRGYTDVRCGIQDAPRDVRYYEVEKIISKLSVPEQTCFEEYIPSSRRNNPKNLYTTWKERFSKLDSQISTEDSQFIKVNIGNHKIGYRICILDPGKSKIRIDNVAIRP